MMPDDTKQRELTGQEVKHLLVAAAAAGIPGRAWDDVCNRAAERLAGQTIDGVVASDFVRQDLRAKAPHLWQAASPQTSGPPPPQGTPEPIEYAQLPPGQRLTSFREQQAQEAKQQRR
jgi:hypothetical protein